jgi:hypothetical protein
VVNIDDVVDVVVLQNYFFSRDQWLRPSGIERVEGSAEVFYCSFEPLPDRLAFI